MTQNTQEMSDTFVDLVKQALENLYDFPALQRHPFVAQLQAQQPQARDTPAHQLRRTLMDAIEQVNPGDNKGVRSGMGRVYNLLHLHYVGGMTIQEAALELGISVRQVYRDLKKGQDSIASILWYKIGNAPATRSPMDTLSSIESEVTQVQGHIQSVNMSDLTARVIDAVGRLAEQLQVTLAISVVPDVTVATNLTLARQVLMSLFSQTIQKTQTDISIQLSETDSAPTLRVQYTPTGTTEILTPVTAQFIQQLGWRIQHQPDQFVLTMGGRDVSVLIIDDNPGLVDLMKRYLTSESYTVMTANSGHDGLQLAQSTLPDAIIMDLMMPEMDGWEMLQRLRTLPATSDTPIIICSVINDPQLAFSLGASKFITKPVDKAILLQALAELEL